MFFNGDTSARKRVDLGGRSSKQRNLEKVLEQNRLERKRRQEFRQRTSAATTIQKYFRGRKDFEMAREKVRKQFHKTFGDRCQNADRRCFGPNSEFLPQLLFFFTGNNHGDITLLVEACRLLLQYVRDGESHRNVLLGNIVSLLSDNDYSSYNALVDRRVKKLSHLCLLAVYENRIHLKNQLLISSTSFTIQANLLLETVACLTNSDLPWVCKIVNYLLERKAYLMLRSIILSHLHNVKFPEPNPGVSSLEHVLVTIATHSVHHLCSNIEPRWSFSSQILSIPFIWHHFPVLKEVCWTKGLGKHYIHQMALDLPGHRNVLPDDIQQEYPGNACVLGNLLEAAGAIFSEPRCPSHMVIDFLNVSTYLMEAMPIADRSAREKMLEDDLSMDEDRKEALSPDLQKQISSSTDRSLLNNLVNTLFRNVSRTAQPCTSSPSSEEVEAVGAVCAFLHVTFSTMPHELFMTLLAYGTELVSALWNYIKRCHDNHRWPSYSKLTADLPGDVPGWLLPLAVFCPVYKHMLKFVDTEEFYDQEKPLNLKDIRCLVIIIKQALWQLLWIIPGQTPSFQKVFKKNEDKKLSLEAIKQRARIAMSELLSQLQDWNNRRPFMPADDFHLQEATSETFVSQALTGGSRALEILKQAPFLVPFTSRVKIFASELAASRQSHGSHPALTRHRFKIRRDRILEDAFNQLSTLSEEDLRGSIRVTFVNELGVEEVGIDGGGIFKDFMENIVQAAFDVQYGLFKETTDHFLYPNPGSALVHEQHLQFFHFLGSLLGKAMYEGILVDIPFATFFLSKLKAKSNFLHDLPSLDPELYHHLLFLKHYKGDVSELELYFVVVNNEYGEQIEEELLPGGKDMHVTKENVIQFIHLVANYRLNYQIRNQSLHFLRGFQQLIKKEWIEMFNEREIQLLISGSLESFDIDDLRLNTHYNGGYHSDHHAIQIFWQVLKNFSLEHQKKFLKFVTGCSRGPLLGFKHLEPKFCIQRVGDLNLDRLPTAATCMNLLKLPPYESIEQMQTKLLYAISAEAGFDLS